MESQQIRQAFVDFFVEREHVLRPSASLIPVDPTLLLNNAGMVPFKPYLSRRGGPPLTAGGVGAEVCSHHRHRHHRHDPAPPLLLRDDGQFQLRRLLQGEGHPLGLRVRHRAPTGSIPSGFGTPSTRPTRKPARSGSTGSGYRPRGCKYGGADNFWQMGVPGPCGPCSEIFYDKGSSTGAKADRSAAARIVTSRSGTWSSCRTSRTSPFT